MITLKSPKCESLPCDKETEPGSAMTGPMEFSGTWARAEIAAACHASCDGSCKAQCRLQNLLHNVPPARVVKPRSLPACSPSWLHQRLAFRNAERPTSDFYGPWPVEWDSLGIKVEPCRAGCARTADTRVSRPDGQSKYLSLAMTMRLTYSAGLHPMQRSAILAWKTLPREGKEVRPCYAAQNG